MASLEGKYSADLAAGILTEITGGGITSGSEGTYLINFCNRIGTTTSVRLAITTGSAPVNADYLEFDSLIDGNGILSRWPVPLGLGWQVYAQASSTGVSINILGRKEG